MSGPETRVSCHGFLGYDPRYRRHEPPRSYSAGLPLPPSNWPAHDRRLAQELGLDPHADRPLERAALLVHIPRSSWQGSFARNDLTSAARRSKRTKAPSPGISGRGQRVRVIPAQSAAPLASTSSGVVTESSNVARGITFQVALRVSFQFASNACACSLPVSST